MGGEHPQWGTHNALLSLGDKIYLEVIASNPKEVSPTHSLPFQTSDVDINGLKTGLVTWAIRPDDINETHTFLSQNSFNPGEILKGQRAKTDGTLLSWQLSHPNTMHLDGIIPFLLDWGNSPHPGDTDDHLCTLKSLIFKHPDIEHIKEIFGKLNISGSYELIFAEAEIPSLTLACNTPNGLVTLG